MRTIEELVDQADDAWALVVAWRSAAARPVDILPADPEAGRETLLALQVTTRSPLGSIAYRSGGILIDEGFLRILGSGHPRIGGGLREWNETLGGRRLDPPISRFMLVAYDVLGGFFAINGGAWPGDVGLVHYWAPDTLAWEALEMGHSAFVEWVMSPELDAFYSHLRWSGWQAEVASIGPDAAILVHPPLGFRGPAGEGGGDIDSRSRDPVPADEHWYFTHELARQTADLADGSEFTFGWRR